MTEDDALYLLTEAGRDLIARTEDGLGDPARAILRLRKSGADPTQVTAAFEVATARRRAGEKFGSLGATLSLTGEALEQASSAGCAAYHARRMVDAGIRCVLDLCGGIGADAIAFARAGLLVLLVEVDPVRALFAAENARAAGLDNLIHVRCADVSTELKLMVAEAMALAEGISESVKLGDVAAWFDPARRSGGRRLHAPDDYIPPLSLVNSLWSLGVTNIGVKMSPAVDHAVALEWGRELEFISDRGECKEGLLWSGTLCRGARISATVLRNGVAHTLPRPLPEVSSFVKGRGAQDAPGNSTPVDCEQEILASANVIGHTHPSQSIAILYEPDPAVIRAHLVQDLAVMVGASLIDPQVAYLIGDAHNPTPFADAYRILDRFPFHITKLQRALKERSVGRVIIKKRAFPHEPEQVRKQLKLTGDQEMVVVLTRVGLQHQAILCLPVVAL